MKFFARTGSRKSAARRSKKRRRGWRWVLAFFLVALPLALIAAVLAFYAVWAQTFDLKRVGTMPERNTVFDVNGKIYSRLAGANRLKVSLKEVSPLFIQALLVREDTRFYEHGGIDWRGVARALYRDIRSGSAKEGASSITQQLARNSLPLGGRTISRKLLEAMVALRIERELTKDQILELYVNRIYFGSGCYGVETASQSYFGKNASKLDLSESALLAGLIRSPNRFSPLKNPKGSAVQRDTVLDRLQELKKITATQAQAAKREKINSHPRRRTLIQENYAMDAVQRDLNLLLTTDQIDNGGLFIYTTLDPDVQKAATDALEKQLAKVERLPGFKHPLKAQYRAPEDGEDNAMPYLEGALVAIDNASGGIRALVGGRDYAQSKFNRALTPANRQIGSAFKPFVYTLAFTHGLLPGAAVSDEPIQPGEIQGAGNWSPGNSDGRYVGIKPVSYGLIQSRNTMSVRVGEFAGLDDTQKIATTLGLGENIPHGAAIYIGSFETNSEGFDRGLHRFSQRRHSQTVLHHRADRRSAPSSDLSRRPRHAAGARPGCYLDDDRVDGGSAHPRHRGERAIVRLQASRRGQDRDDERFQGRVVRRFHQLHNLRRLGRIRSADHHHTAWLRFGSRSADLDAGHDESGRPLSGRAIHPTSRLAASDRLLNLQCDRDQRLHGRRNGL